MQPRTHKAKRKKPFFNNMRDTRMVQEDDDEVEARY